MPFEIKPIPIPEDARCQEASVLSVHCYIPCSAPATSIIYHEKDRRGYYMCDPCASHNLRNRGGKLVAAKPGSVAEATEKLLLDERYKQREKIYRRAGVE